MRMSCDNCAYMKKRLDEKPCIFCANGQPNRPGWTPENCLRVTDEKPGNPIEEAGDAYSRWVWKDEPVLRVWKERRGLERLP